MNANPLTTVMTTVRERQLQRHHRVSDNLLRADEPGQRSRGDSKRGNHGRVAEPVRSGLDPPQAFLSLGQRCTKCGRRWNAPEPELPELCSQEETKQSSGAAPK